MKDVIDMIVIGGSICYAGAFTLLMNLLFYLLKMKINVFYQGGGLILGGLCMFILEQLRVNKIRDLRKRKQK